MPNLGLTESGFETKFKPLLLRLIEEYRRAADQAIHAMVKAYGFTDLLRAWRRGDLKEDGNLSTIHGTYSFHGCGCRFEINNRTVDVDFGPDGRHDGFDAWRLWLFAQSMGNRELDLPAIERGVRFLEAQGIIQKLGGLPSPHLYYLTDGSASPAS